MNLNKSEAFDFISGILFIAELERFFETEIWDLGLINLFHLLHADDYSNFIDVELYRQTISRSIN